MTKEEAIAEMERRGACPAAAQYVRGHESSDLETIWRSCPNIGWLIWAARLRAPAALDEFIRRCAGGIYVPDASPEFYVWLAVHERAGQSGVVGSPQYASAHRDAYELHLAELHGMWAEVAK